MVVAVNTSERLLELENGLRWLNELEISCRGSEMGQNMKRCSKMGAGTQKWLDNLCVDSECVQGFGNASEHLVELENGQI